MSRFDGKKAIHISSPPALAPIPAIIRPTTDAHSHVTWLLQKTYLSVSAAYFERETRLLTAILCNTPNLKFSNLVAIFDGLTKEHIEVQDTGEAVVWLDSQEACPIYNVR